MAPPGASMQGAMFDEALLATPAMVENPGAALFREWHYVESRPASAYSIGCLAPEPPSGGRLRASHTHSCAHYTRLFKP